MVSSVIDKILFFNNHLLADLLEVGESPADWFIQTERSLQCPDVVIAR